ncbi:hypothetical protein SDC9_89877 [bioreactor metagenome]|uniref:Uncharacterized protein n=1 Tax=bioreactor metagenome TaxID=1076179 RepID=A0A645A053_9ZZZZ
MPLTGQPRTVKTSAYACSLAVEDTDAGCRSDEVAGCLEPCGEIVVLDAMGERRVVPADLDRQVAAKAGVSAEEDRPWSCNRLPEWFARSEAGV